MDNISRIIELMKKNNGYITSAEVTKEGISRSSLSYLLRKGKIERSERGVYILPEIWDDELFNIQQRYKKGVFSLATALYLLDLTDRTPIKYNMTFPQNYNTSYVDKKRVIANRVKEEVYELGKEEIKTPGGNIVTCYSAERTLCDILKKNHAIDIQLISEAFKRYVVSDKKDIVLLSEYGKRIGVDERLRSYLEVLI